jgi:hypothetical protein
MFSFKCATMKPETIARRAREAEESKRENNLYHIQSFREKYESNLSKHNHQYAHEVWGELLLQYFGYDIDGRK